MLVRGYETQRTDSFNYLTTTMKRFFDTLADRGDDLVAYAKKRVESLRNGEVPLQRGGSRKILQGPWFEPRSSRQRTLTSLEITPNPIAWPRCGWPNSALSVDWGSRPE